MKQPIKNSFLCIPIQLLLHDSLSNLQSRFCIHQVLFYCPYRTPSGLRKEWKCLKISFMRLQITRTTIVLRQHIREGFVLAVPITRLLPVQFIPSQTCDGYLYSLTEGVRGTSHAKLCRNTSRRLRPIDAFVIFATMTTHLSLSACYSCQPTPQRRSRDRWSRTTQLPFNLTTRDKVLYQFNQVGPTILAHPRVRDSIRSATAFSADYFNWQRSGDSFELAPISAQISIIFIVPEFQCTSRCSRIRDPGFLDGRSILSLFTDQWVPYFSLMSQRPFFRVSDKD